MGAKKISSILSEYLERKKKSRPGYSLRALARDLDVAPSFLSAVFNGKKLVPPAQIGKLAKILEIDAATLIEIKRLAMPEELRSAATRPLAETPTISIIPARETSVLLRQWYYPVILDLTTCTDFGGSVDEIGSRLGLHPEATAVAVRDLLGAGLLEEVDGRLRKTEMILKVSSNRSRTEVRRYHLQQLERAQQELQQRTSDEDLARRVITGMSIATEPERIPVARKMLADALAEIAEYLASGEGSEVFQLSAQLFSHTPPSKK